MAICPQKSAALDPLPPEFGTPDSPITQPQGFTGSEHQKNRSLEQMPEKKTRYYCINCQSNWEFTEPQFIDYCPFCGKDDPYPEGY